jgi:cyclopropane fatty-acyl-phospholipid synthase-like methyltransferase
MDIGCNRGWFSEMAAEEGSQVIAVDIDESNVSRLYHKVKENGASILPVFMDCCAPTPTHGVTGGYPDACERFQSELVLALAITHHLIFKRTLTFSAVAKQLAQFSKKWLLVEFVPPDDKYVSEWMNEKFHWYNLDGFKEALGQFFSRIEVMESSPSPRLLLFCEKSG